MKQEDVKIGDKVVPHTKTNSIMNFDQWLEEYEGKKFKKDGFATVTHIIQGKLFLNGFGVFNASDFEPYIEPAKDNNSKHPLIRHTAIQGNRLIVTLRDGKTGEAMRDPSEPWDDLKANAIALARALGQTVDDIEIVINPQPKTQDKPTEPLTFEVGEMVKFRDDLIDGKKYDGITYFDLMKSQLPETFALPKFNALRDCKLDRWCFPLAVLEKVPQPAKHEVIIDGVKYVKEP